MSSREEIGGGNTNLVGGATWTQGKIGQAIRFNGSNGYLSTELFAKTWASKENGLVRLVSGVMSKERLEMIPVFTDMEAFCPPMGQTNTWLSEGLIIRTIRLK